MFCRRYFIVFIISEFIGPIFTKFSGYVNIIGGHDQSGLLFAIVQGTLLW